MFQLRSRRRDLVPGRSCFSGNCTGTLSGSARGHAACKLEEKPPATLQAKGCRCAALNTGNEINRRAIQAMATWAVGRQSTVSSIGPPTCFYEDSQQRSP